MGNDNGNSQMESMKFSLFLLTRPNDFNGNFYVFFCYNEDRETVFTKHPIKEVFILSRTNIHSTDTHTYVGCKENQVYLFYYSSITSFIYNVAFYLSSHFFLYSQEPSLHLLLFISRSISLCCCYDSLLLYIFITL